MEPDMIFPFEVYALEALILLVFWRDRGYMEEAWDKAFNDKIKKLCRK